MFELIVVLVRSRRGQYIAHSIAYGIYWPRGSFRGYVVRTVLGLVLGCMPGELHQLSVFSYVHINMWYSGISLASYKPHQSADFPCLFSAGERVRVINLIVHFRVFFLLARAWLCVCVLSVTEGEKPAHNYLLRLNRQSLPFFGR